MGDIVEDRGGSLDRTGCREFSHKCVALQTQISEHLFCANLDIDPGVVGLVEVIGA
jgi:hypothetical protein